MSILDRENIVADGDFNRWMVPPAALLIHLSIGMIYGFSIFWPELTMLIGSECSSSVTFIDRVFTSSCDWLRSDVVWTFAIAIVFLGMSAAVFGHWLEKAGPRKAGFAAAVTWGGGLMIASIGVSLHQLWLVWLGAGVIGGIGLGLGYISPVSTLIKWFNPAQGAAKYNAVPRLKNIAYVNFLPRKSEDDAQKIRPIILANDSSAPKPVAIAPIIKGSKLLAAISWNIGFATDNTPMPADTFRHKIPHNNQN